MKALLGEENSRYKMQNAHSSRVDRLRFDGMNSLNAT
jgi:hypothetical protein